MATKTTTPRTAAQPQPPTPESASEQPQQPPMSAPTDLTALIERKRQLDAQIKAARAAQPTLSKLERVIDRQSRVYGKWVAANLAERTAARVQAGQDPAQALDAVVEFYKALAQPLIAAKLTGVETESGNATPPPPLAATEPE